MKKETLKQPKKMVKGTEVYQKENSFYWFCRINRVDEFMFVQTEDLEESDIWHDINRKKLRLYDTPEKEQFLKNVLAALELKDKKGFWVSVNEPSKDKKSNKIQFVEGRKPMLGLSPWQWQKLFELYSPENRSCMIQSDDYLLIGLRLLKDGLVTLDELTTDSKKLGNYIDSEDSINELEPSGSRGFLSFIFGNTRKILANPNNGTGFSIGGGAFFEKGSEAPFSKLVPLKDVFFGCSDATTLVKLHV